MKFSAASRYRMFASFCVLFYALSRAISGQTVQNSTQSTLADGADKNFRDGKYAQAERDLRDLAKIDSSNVHTQLYLGHTLFKQEKYAEAVGPYERAKLLNEGQKRLGQTETRVLTDQLVMSYGMSGQFRKVHVLLNAAIQKDPDYPLNYYNRACGFAEEGDKLRMMTALKQAFDRRRNVLKGEQMPDPRTDPSFQKYTADVDFVKLMKDLGLK